MVTTLPRRKKPYPIQAVRMNEEIRKRLKRRARDLDMSVSALITSYVETGLARDAG